MLLFRRLRLKSSAGSQKHITAEAFKGNFPSANAKQALCAPHELGEIESLFMHRFQCAQFQSKAKNTNRSQIIQMSSPTRIFSREGRKDWEKENQDYNSYCFLPHLCLPQSFHLPAFLPPPLKKCPPTTINFTRLKPPPLCQMLWIVWAKLGTVGVCHFGLTVG